MNQHDETKLHHRQQLNKQRLQLGDGLQADAEYAGIIRRQRSPHRPHEGR
jgi:hypothetical protein